MCEKSRVLALLVTGRGWRFVRCDLITSIWWSQKDIKVSSWDGTMDLVQGIPILAWLSSKTWLDCWPMNVGIDIHSIRGMVTPKCSASPASMRIGNRLVFTMENAWHSMHRKDVVQQYRQSRNICTGHIKLRDLVILFLLSGVPRVSSTVNRDFNCEMYDTTIGMVCRYLYAYQCG